LYNSDFQNAESSFQKAHAYDLGFVPVNAYIAFTNSKLGNLKQAAVYYDNIINADTAKKEYNAIAAQNFELIGDTTKALDILKKARKSDPTDRVLLLNVATIYNNRGDYKSLAPLIKPLLDLNPNNADIAFVAGNCYDHLAQYDKAESFYLQAVELNNGSSYDPMFNLGLLYLKMSSIKSDDGKKDITYAAQWLEKANEISPNDIKCLKLLQIVYKQTGNENQLQRVNDKLRDLTN